MIWGGIGYGIFKYAEPRVGSTLGLWFGGPFVVIGFLIAILKVSEMTFLPATLNFLRLSLNAKSRIWSQGTDSYSEMDVGYIMPTNAQKEIKSNKSYEQVKNDEFQNSIGKL
jgi:hypothetical protein